MSDTNLNPGAGPEQARTLERAANIKTQVVALDVGGAAGPEKLVDANNPVPVGGTVLAAIQTLLDVLAATVGNADSPFVPGSSGQIMLAKRRDADTSTVNADGDLATLNMDEAGRLKVATQPGAIAASGGSITASGATVVINTARIGTLSIALVATTLVGHNAIFEFSNDSTNGTDGNWKTVQAVRTDSNVIETTTGVLTATPAYGWELNVSAYAWFRVRATAHTSGTAAYTLKPGSFATEPVPSSQNPPLQEFTFSQAGVIALNTVLMTIDCLNFRSLSIQCTSMGTSGVVTFEWSNNGTTWATNFAAVNGTAGPVTTMNFVGVVSTPVYARYLRLRLSTATTAGTTAFNLNASQSPSTAMTQIIGSVGVANGTNRIGLVASSCIWYDDSNAALAAAATFTSASRDLAGSASGVAITGATTYVKELRLSAESDQAGTLWLEVSRDNTNWRRVKSVPTAAVTGGGQYAEIIHRPSWRYARVGFTNGATLQTRFSLGSILMAA